MRLVAFSFFVSAAFAWVPPFIDRAGLAALGFAFLALALSPGRLLGARPARMNLPPKRVGLPELDGDGADDLLARLAAYEP